MALSPKFLRPRILVPIILGLLVLIIAGTVVFKDYALFTPKNKDEKAKQETLSLIERVGQLVELPENEMPTLATVTDEKTLPKQEFYQNARNGDKILIYTTARKAYLYRPRTHKLIAVGPVIFEAELRKEAQQTVSETPTPSVTATPSPSPTQVQPTSQ